jgi:atrial natriuretic peptide receptor A
MLTAYDNGYLHSNEYVFMDVELFEFGGDYWGSHAWSRGDSRDADAKRAYEAMLRITLYELQGEAWDNFTTDVKFRAKKDYNFDYGKEKVCYPAH